MQRAFIISGILATAGLSIADCQEAEGRYDPGQPYCYKFTWLGPKSEEVYNATSTCAKIKGQPCFQPLVSSNDTTLPNVDHMWKTMNRSEIACHMRQGYVCVKYTFNYNNAVLNISYFCGKMMEDKSTPIVDGCYTQKVNSHIIEACACTSEPGGSPCNLSENLHPSVFTSVLFMILSWFIAHQ